MKLFDKRWTTSLLAGAASITTVLAMTSPAQATDPYTPSGGPALELVANNVEFEDYDAEILFECEEVKLGGSIESSGTARAHSERAGVLDDIEAVDCIEPGYFGSMDITARGGLDVTVTGDATGTVWPVELRHVVLDALLVGCEFTMTNSTAPNGGVISGDFDTATQEFVPTGSNLEVENAAGVCFLLGIADGNDIEVAGTWTNITTPALTLTH